MDGATKQKPTAEIETAFCTRFAVYMVRKTKNAKKLLNAVLYK
jgi:hypothetical protein